jgi:hypothetical protein
MKRLLPVAVVSSAALLALAVHSGRSGDNVPSESESRIALNLQREESSARRRVRLPNHFAQLDLNEAQRQRIYTLQIQYGEKIEQLEAQLAALREKRDHECEAVLTGAQQRKLAEIRRERERGKARKGPAARAATPQ